MRILVITVAGMATRFSRSVGYECVKCIYHEGNPDKSILNRIVRRNEGTFDTIIIVGGYRFSELQSYIHDEFEDLSSKIDLIMNDHFSDYGSGYSLFLGLQRAFEIIEDSNHLTDTEIVFAEGDLYVDSAAFSRVIDSSVSVVTANRELIQADRSVAFYRTVSGKIKYIYDVSHGQLSIDEPFEAIWNSGQIWKFKDASLLQEACEELDDMDIQGTNLVIIQGYFDKLQPADYEVIYFDDWINCNTVDDYRYIDILENKGKG